MIQFRRARPLRCACRESWTPIKLERGQSMGVRRRALLGWVGGSCPTPWPSAGRPPTRRLHRRGRRAPPGAMSSQRQGVTPFPRGGAIDGAFRRVHRPAHILTMLRVLVIPFSSTSSQPQPGAQLHRDGALPRRSITDFLDGYLARKRGQVSILGSSSTARGQVISWPASSCCRRGPLPAWLVVVLHGRELAILGLRSTASSGARHPAAKRASNKTACRLVGSCSCSFTSATRCSARACGSIPHRLPTPSTCH